MRRIVDTSDPVNWSHPLNRGLVSWFIALPDQQRGAIWRDLCRRNNGTLTNGPTWQGANGRPGGWGSLAFDGSNDYVIEQSVRLFGSNAFTFSLWINTTTTATNKSAFGTLDTGASTIIHLSLNADEAALASVGETFWQLRADGGLTRNVSFANNIYDGLWHHLVLTRNGSGSQVFVDGMAASLTLGFNNLAAGNTLNCEFPITYGAVNNRTTIAGHAAVTLDGIRVYQGRELNEAESRELYQLERQGYPGLLNRLPTRRYAPEQAVAGGLSIPIAAYHYNHHLGSMA